MYTSKADLGKVVDKWVWNECVCEIKMNEEHRNKLMNAIMDELANSCPKDRTYIR